MAELVQVMAKVHATFSHVLLTTNQTLWKEGYLTSQTPELNPCIRLADTTMLQVSSTN